MLRHIVARENLTPDGLIRHPELVHHGAIVARRVAALAGAIDPLTHLNLDFTAHRLVEAIVVERLEVGAAVVLDGDQFLVASVKQGAVIRLGRADLGRRRLDWQLALRRG